MDCKAAVHLYCGLLVSKKKKPLIEATTWMNLQRIMLSGKKKPTFKVDTLYNSTYIDLKYLK